MQAATLTAAPPPQTLSSVETYRALVVELRTQRMEGAAILPRLWERGYSGTLSSLYRFLHRLDPPRPKTTVRLERSPGAEAQVDFGYAGRPQQLLGAGAPDRLARRRVGFS